MRSRLFIAFTICLFTEIGFAQYKLKDLPYDLSFINQNDSRGKQGIWVFYDQDSIVQAIQHFVNDTLNGYFEMYWYTTGKISDKGYYKRGKLDSTFLGYWEDGNLRGEAHYINGMLEGIVTSYGKEGTLTTRLNYHLGKVDSSYKESFVDSTIEWDYQAHDKIDTIKTAFPSDWNKKYAIYTNDTLAKEIDFYRDVVAIESFYEKAILTKRIIYSNKKPYITEKIFYYQNGVLSKTELYDKKGELIKNN